MPTLNQPPVKPEFNAWTGNAILKSAVAREGGGWVDERVPTGMRMVAVLPGARV